MKIYIASSWKNQHAVEMLSRLLRERDHEVLSFVDNNYGELEAVKKLGFDDWCNSAGGVKSFKYDTESAMQSDLVIYISPSGKNAAAECGMAYAKDIPIYGLYAKGEDFGLMRKMMTKWYDNFIDLLCDLNNQS